jgi:hypothetical protein
MIEANRRKRPSPALVLAVIALIVAAAGTAVADQGASISVLSKSEKKTIRKIARNIANRQITARAAKLSVRNAKRVNGHDAACPAGTTLVSGYCFDIAPRGPVGDVYTASDDCRSKGGFLPTTLLLRSTDGKVDLGRGPLPDSSYTDSIHDASADPPQPARINLVFNGGGILTVDSHTGSEYHCAYPLVR